MVRTSDSFGIEGARGRVVKIAFGTGNGQGGFIFACADTYSSVVGARSCLPCRSLGEGWSRPRERAQPLDFARDPELVERASLRPYGCNPKFAVENESVPGVTGLFLRQNFPRD